jgi:hypothetical protein
MDDEAAPHAEGGDADGGDADDGEMETEATVRTTLRFYVAQRDINQIVPRDRKLALEAAAPTVYAMGTLKLQRLLRATTSEMKPKYSEFKRLSLQSKKEETITKSSIDCTFEGTPTQLAQIFSEFSSHPKKHGLAYNAGAPGIDSGFDDNPTGYLDVGENMCPTVTHTQHAFQCKHSHSHAAPTLPRADGMRAIGGITSHILSVDIYSAKDGQPMRSRETKTLLLDLMDVRDGPLASHLWDLMLSQDWVNHAYFGAGDPFKMNIVGFLSEDSPTIAEYCVGLPLNLSDISEKFPDLHIPTEELPEEKGPFVVNISSFDCKCSVCTRKLGYTFKGHDGIEGPLGIPCQLVETRIEVDEARKIDGLKGQLQSRQDRAQGRQRREEFVSRAFGEFGTEPQQTQAQQKAQQAQQQLAQLQQQLAQAQQMQQMQQQQALQQMQEQQQQQGMGQRAAGSEPALPVYVQRKAQQRQIRLLSREPKRQRSGQVALHQQFYGFAPQPSYAQMAGPPPMYAPQPLADLSAPMMPCYHCGLRDHYPVYCPRNQRGAPTKSYAYALGLTIPISASRRAPLECLSRRSAPPPPGRAPAPAASPPLIPRSRRSSSPIWSVPTLAAERVMLCLFTTERAKRRRDERQPAQPITVVDDVVLRQSLRACRRVGAHTRRPAHPLAARRGIQRRPGSARQLLGFVSALQNPKQNGNPAQSKPSACPRTRLSPLYLSLALLRLPTSRQHQPSELREVRTTPANGYTEWKQPPYADVE